MDRDENIKRNRLALLQELVQLLKSVADLSKLY
jgi:glycyl-tRNA synthetase beta subunit